jgi:hypothetical protein
MLPPTECPSEGTRAMPGPADEDRGWLHGWRRRVLVAVVVAAGAVLVGAVIGILLAGRSPGPTRSAVIADLEPLASGSLVAAPDAKPEELDDPLGMGAVHGGVALLAVGDVDDVRTADGPRRAPEGSNLVAFQVGDWTCEVKPCEPWRSLKPQIEVDGVTLDLPGSGDTFVVVVPPGSGAVDLVLDADGYTQSLSLVGGEPGPDNIVLLGDRDSERRVQLGLSFRLSEQTSMVLDDGAGGRADTFERDVTVDYAQLRFFLDDTAPSSPRRAFLVVNAYYSYPGRAGTFILAPGEVTFVAEHGARYQARDLDPAEATGLLGFEVPASVRSGTVVIGGSTDKVSTTGVPYQSALQEYRVPIDLG